MNLFNDMVITALKKQLDASSLRQRVVANNLANLDTPGFKKSTVSFEEQLAKELKRADNRGVSINNGTRGAGANGVGTPASFRGGTANPGQAGINANMQYNLAGAQVSGAPQRVGRGPDANNRTPQSVGSGSATGPAAQQNAGSGSAGKRPGNSASAALDNVRPKVVRDRWTATRADGNNVDLEEEMVILASNAFMYQITSQLISNKYSELSNVIRGGR